MEEEEAALPRDQARFALLPLGSTHNSPQLAGPDS